MIPKSFFEDIYYLKDKKSYSFERDYFVDAPLNRNLEQNEN